MDSGLEGLAEAMSGAKIDDPKEVRDRRYEIIQHLQHFPSLHKFFSNINQPIEADGKLVELVKPNCDPHITQWMGIIEVMASTFYQELETRDELIKTHRISLKATKDALAAAVAGGKKKTKDNDDDDVENTPIQHPTPFTGDTKDDMTRAREYRAWRSRVRGIWIGRARQFKTERSKLVYLPSVLGGTAYLGVAEGLETITKHPDDQAQWEWLEAERVIAELDKKYDTHSDEADAMQRWDDLHMDKKEWSNFNNFVTEYIAVAKTLGYDDATKVMNFECKLSKKLNEALANQPDVPGRLDFDGWVELTRKLWLRQQRSEQINRLNHADSSGGQNKKNSNGNGNGGGGGKQEGHAGEPMDLDAMKLAIAKIPQQERERRYQQGLCMNCGFAGHFAKQCKKKTNVNPPQGRGGFGSFNPRGRGGGGRGGFGNPSFGNPSFGGNQNALGGFGNNGYSNQGTRWNANYQGFGNNQGVGGFGRGGAPNSGFGGLGRGNNGNGGYNARGGHQQLRFAGTPEYIPNQPGFVLGEADSDYGDRSANPSHGYTADGGNASWDQGNV